MTDEEWAKAGEPTPEWKAAFGPAAQKKFEDQFRPSTEFERAFGTAQERFPLSPTTGKDALRQEPEKQEDGVGGGSEKYYERLRTRFDVNPDGTFKEGDRGAYKRVMRKEERLIRAMRGADPKWRKTAPAAGASDPEPATRTQFAAVGKSSVRGAAEQVLAQRAFSYMQGGWTEEALIDLIERTVYAMDLDAMILAVVNARLTKVLADYYSKSEVYTKGEVDRLLTDFLTSADFDKQKVDVWDGSSATTKEFLVWA